MRCCAARTCARASSSRRSSPGARRSRSSRRTCASSSISGARRSATPASSPNSVQQRIDAIYRAESRRVFATLVRLLGDFDLAEEALHDAFRAALEQWPEEGLPENRRARPRGRAPCHARGGGGGDRVAEGAPRGGEPIEDDRLRLDASRPSEPVI